MKTVGATVEVKPSRPEVGWGLFALIDMAKGDFIAEYTGEKIPTKIADTLKTRYLFELNEEWTIDGTSPSNIARSINHSCEPNAEAEIVDGEIIIRAAVDIVAGEELTLDYGEEYFDEFIRPVGCKCTRCSKILISV